MAKTVKQAGSDGVLLKKIMPPTCLFAGIVVMAVLHFILPVRRIITPFLNLFGIIPLIAGIAINLVADRAFHSAGTTVRPFEESSALITSGVFRISRNPMYLGFVLIFSSIAVLMGSLTVFAVIPVFAVLLDRCYIKAEERMLSEKFGSAFEEYRKTTRRWL